MDSIRASEAPDTGSIPVEATHSSLLFSRRIRRRRRKHVEAIIHGLTQSIHPFLTGKLIHFESFVTEGEAIKREKYFK